MKILLFSVNLIFIIFSSSSAFPQPANAILNKDTLVNKISIDEIKKDIAEGLIFLADSQKKETTGFASYKGEWPSYISLRTRHLVVGSGTYYDANAFGVISVHNILSELYLMYPEYSSILPMLDPAIKLILEYRTDSSGTYGFWHSAPPYQTLRSTDIPGKEPFIKRPSTFPLNSKFANNAVNVVDDADDQALATQAILLYNTVMKKSGQAQKVLQLPDSIGKPFEKYRDVHRKNILPYDLINGANINTGAYFTWFGNEHEYDFPEAVFYPFQYMFFFLPSSPVHPQPYDPKMPYWTNDVDVVVNANVLTMLADFKLLNSTEGVKDAFKYLTEKIRSGNFNKASIYYSNRYHFHYAVSRTFAATKGNSLQEAAELLIDDLKKTQRGDGSWASRKIINKKDIIQSTANGLMALLNFGDYKKNNTLENINHAIIFLHKNSVEKNGSRYWRGGVYFSGGMNLRNTLWWKSDSYTTALIIHAFAKYRKFLENQKD